MADDGFQASSAYVQILPDFRGWHKSIKSALSEEDPTFEQAGDRWGKAAVAGFTERLRADFTHLPEAKIRASVDTAKVDEKLDKASRDRKSTIKVTVKEIGGNAKELLGSKAALGFLGSAALGPQAAGLGAVGAGLAVSAGASLAGLAAFGVIAKSEVAKVQTATKALSTAQQQYAAAQQKYAGATTKAQRSSALAAEAKAMAAETAAVKGLSPAERQLGKELTGLSSAWSALGKAESPVIASALAPWVDTATSGLRLLGPLVDVTGESLQFLGNQADKAIRSPFWDSVGSDLDILAGHSLVKFGDALGHVADGIGHLFVDFEPDIEKFPGLIDKGAGAFDRWASSYDKSGFEHFIDHALSKSNVAALKGDLGDVAKILGNVSAATLSFSPAAFTGLSNVLSILAKLSPGQITAIAAIYAYSKLTSGTKLSPGSLLGSLGGLGGLGGKGKGSTAAGEGAASKLAGAATWIPNIALALGAADGVLHLPGVNSTSKSLASNPKDQAPTVPGLGKLPQSFETPFGMPGPKDPRSANNWLTSFSPYERIFTNDLPKAWSISYEAFQVEFAGKITSWFTQSFPHAFDVTRHSLAVAGDNMGHWLGVGWDDSGGWLVSRFAQAGPWAVRALGASGRWLVGAGESAARGLVSGWDRGERDVTGAFGAAHGWVTSGFKGAGSWLTGPGENIMIGLLHGLESEKGTLLGYADSIGNGIKARIKSALHMNSPSKDGIYIGANFTGSIGLGMGSMLPTLQKSADAIAAAMAPSKPSTSPNGLGYSAAQWGQLQALEGASKAGKHLDAHQLHQLHVAHAKHVAAMGSITAKPKAGTSPPGWEAGTPFGRLAAARAYMAASAKLPGVGSSLSPGELTVNFRYVGNDAGVINGLVKGLRYDVAGVSGGDVQKHLGQGPARK